MKTEYTKKDVTASLMFCALLLSLFLGEIVPSADISNS